MTHFVSAACEGERCSICGEPATHKVGEEIMRDDPTAFVHLDLSATVVVPARHNYTAYVCCEHFQMIFGAAVPCKK